MTGLFDEQEATSTFETERLLVETSSERKDPRHELQGASLEPNTNECLVENQENNCSSGTLTPFEENQAYPFGRSVLGRLMRRAFSEESFHVFGFTPLEPIPSSSDNTDYDGIQFTSSSYTHLRDNKVQKVTCRICLIEEDRRHPDIISPCKCSGHSSHVHRQCLDQWRKSCKNPMSKVQCDICKGFYTFAGKRYFKSGISLGSSAFVCYVTVFFYYFSVAYILGFFFQMAMVYWSLPSMFSSHLTDHTLTRLLQTICMNSVRFLPSLSLFGCYRYMSDLLVPIGGTIFILLNVGGTQEWVALLGHLVWISIIIYGAIIAILDIKVMADKMAPKLLAVILDNTDVVLDLESK